MNNQDIHLFSDVYKERIKLNEPLARFTTFKIGGPADVFFEARTVDELTGCIRIAYAHGIPVFVLGGGTNILIGDHGIRGLVVKNNTSRLTVRSVKDIKVDGSDARTVYVESDSGVVFNRLVRFTLDEGLEGFEMHLGLPGSVGGAIYMNSKWMHPEGYAGDRVYRAEILLSDGTLSSVDRSYFHFGYDSSTLQQSKEIVTKVLFELKKGDKNELWDVANKSIAYRRSSQPQGILSAGCTFQNISKAEARSARTPDEMTSAGFLIDNAGLKGRVAGGAQISPVHANFIANTGHATATDVLQLIELAKAEVLHKFGVSLKEEIIRVGEF